MELNRRSRSESKRIGGRSSREASSEQFEFGLGVESLMRIGRKLLEYVRRLFSPEGLTALCAASSVVVTVLIFVFLFVDAFPIFQKMSYGEFFMYFIWEWGYDWILETNPWMFGGNVFVGLWNFITGGKWSPASYQFGILPLIESTLIVVGGAIVIAAPVGILSAVHLAEYCSLRVKTVLKSMVELLASVPSVVYGLVGLTTIVPWLKETFNLSTGSTALAGIVILSIMILPTIISVSEDAIAAVPREFKEASYALGATKFQTIRKVVLPAAAAGIAAAIVLAVARAVGETMAVLMVTGNTPFSITYPMEYFLYGLPDKVVHFLREVFLSPVYPMTAAIALEVGESAWGGTHFQALLGIGFVLFVITYVINSLAEYTILRFSARMKRRTI